VIGNKYVIDSALPETSSFTLVDTLHGVTLFFIFMVIVCTINALRLVKTYDVAVSNTFDKRMAIILLVSYIIINVYFILDASSCI
jgi:hypothetical protein